MFILFEGKNFGTIIKMIDLSKITMTNHYSPLYQQNEPTNYQGLTKFTMLDPREHHYKIKILIFNIFSFGTIIYNTQVIDDVKQWIYSKF